MPLLVAIQKMEPNAATSDGLLAVLLGILKSNGGLDEEQIATKLLCFGVDGVAAYQGCKTEVSKQILKKFVPFMIAVHCCAHRLQLCAKVLSDLEIMEDCEELIKVTHDYFAHSPKRAAEFHTLALLMETKENNLLLKHVKTRWISWLPPMRHLIAEYQSIMTKLWEDRNDRKLCKKAKVQSYSCFLWLLFFSVACSTIDLDRMLFSCGV